MVAGDGVSRRLRVAAAMLEKAGFGTAALAFLAPFLAADSKAVHPVLGAVAFFYGFLLVLVPRSDALTAFVAFSLPGIAAIAGLLLPRRLTWPASVARFVCALAGLAGLANIYLLNPRPYLLIGYYAAEAAFLIATIASAYRLIATLWIRGLGDEAREPADEQPAWSASQELLRRHRDN